MDEKVKEAIFKKVEKEPFAQKFGIKLLDLDEGYSKVEMKFTPNMENFLGLAHGGALFALIDEAFETASNSHGTVAVALNMNITYISPPPSECRLRIPPNFPFVEADFNVTRAGVHVDHLIKCEEIFNLTVIFI
jgi:acyl-CoA thioesterase